jgi:hypothetical protein
MVTCKRPRGQTTFKSLRKNSLNAYVFHSRELITLRSGSFSVFPRLRTHELRRLTPLGLPEHGCLSRPPGHTSGNQLCMQPPSPV